LQQVHRTVSVRRLPGRVFPVVEPRPEVMSPDQWVEFGRAIRYQTVAGAVVLTPEMHRVPMYYSWRHTVGGITSDEELTKILPKIDYGFQGSPVYLALFAKDRFRFPATLAAHLQDDTARPYTIVKLSR
jgi:hypothetical protein